MTVAVYTDGLLERRTEPFDIQLGHLRRSVTAGPPEVVTNAIMHHLIGAYVVEDDTALLVFRRVPL